MKTGSPQPDDEYIAGIVNRHVEILLKSGRRIAGFVIGYFKEDIDNNQSPVTGWHIVNIHNKMDLGIDAFGFLKGEIIRQKDIEEIKIID